MNNKNFQTYFDCGFSKIRAGTFNAGEIKKLFMQRVNSLQIDQT